MTDLWIFIIETFYIALAMAMACMVVYLDHIEKS